MPDGGTTALLSLGFGLGLLHALDADHVMAVSTLASRRPGFATSVRFAVRWASGHGLALLVVVGLALAAGRAIPEEFSRVAEATVGGVMIALGVFVLWDVRRGALHLHFHEHDALPPHAHWHRHGAAVEDARDSAHRAEHRRGHAHTPTLVGALHGAAGSAPLLAVVPAAGQGGFAAAFAYLACFSAGVVVAMLAFGGVLGALFARAERAGSERPMRWMRSGSALGSMALGAYLVALSV